MFKFKRNVFLFILLQLNAKVDLPEDLKIEKLNIQNC